MGYTHRKFAFHYGRKLRYEYYIRKKIFYTFYAYLFVTTILIFVPIDSAFIFWIKAYVPDFVMIKLYDLNKNEEGLGAKTAILCIIFVISVFFNIILDTVVFFKIKYKWNKSVYNSVKNTLYLVLSSVFLIFLFYFFLAVVPHGGGRYYWAITHWPSLFGVSVIAFASSGVISQWTFLALYSFRKEIHSDGQKN